jgi:hypothetical protein
MKAFRVVLSIILKTTSLPFLLIGLFGLSIYALSNIIYRFPDGNDDYHASDSHKGKPKL